MAMNRNFYEKPASDGPLDEAQDNGESASGALLDRARPSRPVKATRVDDAYSRLKREILADRFRPGFQAFEPEIADMLQMSRTPVREALIRLESDGLIELVPRRGVRVLPVSPGDMKDIYQLLTLLEPEAAAEVAQRGVSADEMASLEQCCTAMQAALEQDDLEGWAEADDQFHRELLAMSSNRRMVEYLNILFDQAHRARMITVRLRDRPVASTKDHRDILDAIVAGDADKARQVFREHRERASRELLKLLETSRLSSL